MLGLKHLSIANNKHLNQFTLSLNVKKAMGMMASLSILFFFLSFDILFLG